MTAQGVRCYTNSIETRRPTKAAARCRLLSVMSSVAQRVWTSLLLQVQEVHGRAGGEPGTGLQRKDAHRLAGRAAQPFYREEQDDWDLHRHQQLPDVRDGPAVGVAGKAAGMGDANRN